MIVVLRGPEDTSLSYYHHSKVVTRNTGNFEGFCELFLGGKVLYGPYWNQQHKPKLMFLKYDEMKADLAGSIRNVVEFFGKDLSDEEVATLFDHLTFDNLKTSKGFNFEALLNSKGCDMNPLIRTGIVGGHKEVMSAEMIAAFKAQRELKGTSLSIE